MQKITRKELHELVWTQPMTKACKQFGISDVGIRKACKKHNIPTPAAGYWTKVQCGKKVTKLKLKGNPDELVLIYGGQDHMKSTKTSSLDDVEIPSELVPLAQRMKDRLLKAKPNKEGLVSLKQKSSIPVSIKLEAIDRVVQIVQKMVVLGEHLDVRLIQGSEQIVLETEGEQLKFAIKAKIDKVPYEPTPQELAKLAEWEKERKRLRRTNRERLSWHDWDKPKFPIYNHFPSELFVLEIDDNIYSGLRRTFSDGKVQRLENMVVSILMTAKDHIEYRLKKRKDREDEEVRSMLVQRYRQEMTKFENLEKKRIKEFEELFKQWRKYEEMMEFMKAARQVEDSSAWLNWVESYADFLNPFRADFLNPFRAGLPELIQMGDLNEWELR
jgi:hypothetical protein